MLNRAHGGNIWRYLEDSEEKVIDFSANINPLCLPSRAKSTIIKNIDKLVHYPDPEAKSLKEALAIFHNVTPHNLLVGNGSIELIYLIPKALEAERILIPIPTFSEYEFAARANRAAPLFVKGAEGNNFKVDIYKLIKFIPDVDLVFLCNPNNPTGTFLTAEEVLLLLDVCRRHEVTIVLDEAFMDFVKDSEKLTLISHAAGNKYLLILRSLTKFFALAGLRLGYLIGSGRVIDKLSQFQHPWNVNSLAQAVGERVIKDEEYMKKTRRLILKERAYLFSSLKVIKGLKVFPSVTNFILCKLTDSKIQSAVELSKKLVEQGIIIRNCDNFNGLSGRFFRVAVRKRDENKKLIFALKGVLK